MNPKPKLVNIKVRIYHLFNYRNQFNLFLNKFGRKSNIFVYQTIPMNFTKLCTEKVSNGSTKVTLKIFVENNFNCGWSKLYNRKLSFRHLPFLIRYLNCFLKMKSLFCQKSKRYTLIKQQFTHTSLSKG